MSKDLTLNQNDNPRDSDLEAEVAPLAGGKEPPKRKVPDSVLAAMVAESMKDVPSDEDVSGDEDDPDLLSELQGLIDGDVHEQETPPTLKPTEQSNEVVKILTARLKMYEEAEKNAKGGDETRRARRFHRGLKIIKTLLKQANASEPINSNDIPPEVVVNVRKSMEPVAPSPSSSPCQLKSSLTKTASSGPLESTEAVEAKGTFPSSLNLHQQLLGMLKSRQKQYNVAALTAKESGNNATAITCVGSAQQTEIVINAIQSGQSVDLSNLYLPLLGQEDAKQNLEENKVPTSGDKNSSF